MLAASAVSPTGALARTVMGVVGSATECVVTVAS
ncbi:hypothetical protein JNB_09599 [Janibacter sp. HTCC2649]|nr:hypothetical protein JNB_09599 [Janibacter sp. HTCC2649]